MKHKGNILKKTEEIKNFLLSLSDEKLYELTPTHLQATQTTYFPFMDTNKYIFILAY